MPQANTYRHVAGAYLRKRYSNYVVNEHIT